jgi:hypothetical protein
MTVVCPFESFIILQFNATCYVSWKSTRMFVSASDSGESAGRPGTGSSEGRNKRLRTDGPRPLSDWEFEGLTKCVKAAEQLVFTLAEESRVPGAWRAVQWEEAERADGWRKLILDEQQVEHTRWGMDAVVRFFLVPSLFVEDVLTLSLFAHRPASPTSSRSCSSASSSTRFVFPSPYPLFLADADHFLAGSSHYQPHPSSQRHPSTGVGLHAKTSSSPRTWRRLPRLDRDQLSPPLSLASSRPPHPPRHRHPRSSPHSSRSRRSQSRRSSQRRNDHVSLSQNLYPPLPPSSTRFLPWSSSVRERDGAVASSWLNSGPLSDLRLPRRRWSYSSRRNRTARSRSRTGHG